MRAPRLIGLRSSLLLVGILACGDGEPVAEDASRGDGMELACTGGADCPATQRCAAAIADPNIGNCLRGTTPSQTMCVPQCRGRCVVGPHTLLNPDDPPGIVAGLTTPDCLDAGPAD